MATWVLLGVARFAILVLPFSVVRRTLGERRDTGDAAAPAQLERAALVRAARIAATIDVAARHTPWRSECYPQALTARALLGLARVPHVVSFGVRRDGGALVAHAWVRAGEVTVTGSTGHSYTEVGSFAWAPRSSRGR